MRRSPTRQMIGWSAVVVGLCLFGVLVVAPLVNPSISGWQRVSAGLCSLPIAYGLVRVAQDMLAEAEDKRAADRAVRARELVEQEMAEELRSYQQRPAGELLAEIERGSYGDYSQIWRALRNRTTIQEAGPLLVSVLRSPVNDYTRARCAELLLSLYKPPPGDLTPAKLRSGKYLDEYERALRALPNHALQRTDSGVQATLDLDA